MRSEALVLGILIAVDLFLAFIPAAVASSKGRSFWGFWAFGLIFFVPALVTALVISIPNFPVGSIVKVRRSINLKNGERLPAGTMAKVRDRDIIDGVSVVQVESGMGLHWISRKSVKPA